LLYTKGMEDRPTPAETPPAEPVTCPQCGTPLELPPPTAEQFCQWLGPSASRRLGLFAAPEGLRVSVVVPVYNERGTLEEVIRRVQAVPLAKEIVLVDDASTDGTREVMARMEGQPGVRVFYHETNRGKGAALRTAFQHATGDVVLIQDADLEYDPMDYPRLLQPIAEGRADVVFGSRFHADGPHRVLYFWHSVANRWLTCLSNMFTDLNLSDMETGYKVFRREVIEAIGPTLKQNRFGIEPELTAKVARRRYRIYEVGISYAGRTYQEGKKIGLRDAFKALWCIIRYWKWD
jgi:glycosyltransferase involved in cell wall biosynthesis